MRSQMPPSYGTPMIFQYGADGIIFALISILMIMQWKREKGAVFLNKVTPNMTKNKLLSFEIWTFFSNK